MISHILSSGEVVYGAGPGCLLETCDGVTPRIQPYSKLVAIHGLAISGESGTGEGHRYGDEILEPLSVSPSNKQTVIWLAVGVLLPPSNAV